MWMMFSPVSSMQRVDAGQCNGRNQVARHLINYKRSEVHEIDSCLIECPLLAASSTGQRNTCSLINSFCKQ